MKNNSIILAIILGIISLTSCNKKTVSPNDEWDYNARYGSSYIKASDTALYKLMKTDPCVTGKKNTIHGYLFMNCDLATDSIIITSISSYSGCGSPYYLKDVFWGGDGKIVYDTLVHIIKQNKLTNQIVYNDTIFVNESLFR